MVRYVRPWRITGSFFVNNGRLQRVRLHRLAKKWRIIVVVGLSSGGLASPTQDQTSSRPNTLSDDSDDLQKQLDNEARDRILYAKPKTIWVFHFPNKLANLGYSARRPSHRREINRKNIYRKDLEASALHTNTTGSCSMDFYWTYENQDKWPEVAPACASRFQSPVDLPARSLVRTKGARPLEFCNYNVPAKSMFLVNKGNSLTLYGKWEKFQRPMLYGGAGYSRRYRFHSLTLRWPSEHKVGGIQYPMESQALHISADYPSLADALKAVERDPMAIVNIATIYEVSNTTSPGLREIVLAAKKKEGSSMICLPAKPLNYYIPCFKEYACYHGSLTTPPCTEAVLWLIRGRTLPVSRDILLAAYSIVSNGELMKGKIRYTKPLNDRKVYYFH